MAKKSANVAALLRSSKMAGPLTINNFIFARVVVFNLLNIISLMSGWATCMMNISLVNKPSNS